MKGEMERERLRKGQRPRSYPSHLELLNFVTALVPSEMACFESSPGRIRRTAVMVQGQRY